MGFLGAGARRHYNHYLGQGVKGGLLLMFLFICLLWIGFRYVGQILQLRSINRRSVSSSSGPLGASVCSPMQPVVSELHISTSPSCSYIDAGFDR